MAGTTSQATGTVDPSSTTTSTTTSSTAFGTPRRRRSPTYGDAYGDPIAYFGDVKREFYLPLQKLVPVLETPDLRVLASTFQGQGEEQWFDRVVVTGPGGEEVVRVAIKPDIRNFNRTCHSCSPPNAFETLNVNMWGTTAMVVMPPPDVYFHDWKGIHVAFSRLRLAGPEPREFAFSGFASEMMIGHARREAVLAASNSVKVLIVSTSGQEFYGDESDLAVKYAHLDIQLLGMQNSENFRGILPELWGLRPLSDTTRALLKAPSSGPFYA